jgi:hypothetical protein
MADWYQTSTYYVWSAFARLGGWKGLLRWIAVLPGAFLAMPLSSFPLHLVLYQTLTGSGIIEPYPEAPERILSPLVATLAFVWVGSRIAPNRKVEAAITLFGLTLLGCGASLALAVSGAHFGNVSYYVRLGGLPIIAGIAGAFIGLYVAYRENVKAKETNQTEKIL